MPLPFTLRQLEYFDAIASEGSFVAAAQRCKLSTSALASALDELESRLGLQLVVRRKGKGVTLAPEGARLLAHARQLLASAEYFASEVSQGATALTGQLTVGCFPTLAPFFLPPVIDGFRRAHAGLALEFVEATAPELATLLLNGRIDVALLYSVDVAPSLVFEPLREYRPYVIVSTSHRLAGRDAVSLEELAGEDLIQLDLQPSRQNTELMFGRVGLMPRIRHATTNYELARCLVGRGLGYSILIQRLASSVTYDGHEITSLEIEGGVPQNTVGLARPIGAADTARYRTLKDMLSAD